MYNFKTYNQIISSEVQSPLFYERAYVRIAALIVAVFLVAIMACCCCCFCCNWWVVTGDCFCPDSAMSFINVFSLLRQLSLTNKLHDLDNFFQLSAVVGKRIKKKARVVQIRRRMKALSLCCTALIFLLYRWKCHRKFFTKDKNSNPKSDQNCMKISTSIFSPFRTSILVFL